MVFAVQCPNAKCRKFMLVEDHDRGKAVPCLLCKTVIRVGAVQQQKRAGGGGQGAERRRKEQKG